jgi:hypothetical protein
MVAIHYLCTPGTTGSKKINHKFDFSSVPLRQGSQEEMVSRWFILQFNFGVLNK